jgi:hypothetical protein
MTEKIKGSEMTQSEMLRELRQDIRDMNNKIDESNRENNKSHADFQKQLAKIDKASSINTTKLVMLVSVLSIVIAGAVNYGFHTIA